jgi:hypothetical protein
LVIMRYHLRATGSVLTFALTLPGALTARAEPAAQAESTVAAPVVSRGIERPPGAALSVAPPAWGVMADVGLPDGAGASLVIRPKTWIRFQGGGTYNLISSGLRAGISLIPFGWGPSLSVEGGHYFDGDANGLVGRLAGTGYQSNAILQRVGYDYANVHLGLELGTRRATFYIHAGMSYIRTSVHNIDQAIEPQPSPSPSSTQLSFKQDPVIRAITPSAKLGLIVYLW